nr:hypothetical protein EFAU004_01887 [Enterococcus faecium Aus0004]
MPLSLKKKFFPLIFLDRKLYSMMREKVVWGNVNEKKSSNRSALFIFWFFPIVLLPFTWVNAVVQGAEILGLIQGSGFVVSRNFPALIVFYLVISVGLLLPKSLINHYNWQLLYFSCLLVFTSTFSLLPRLIIGPNGLSESGLKDLAYSSMYFLTIKPWFYLVIASFILATFFYFWTEIRIKSERSVSIKNNY